MRFMKNSDTERLNFILCRGYNWFHNWNYISELRYDNCLICQNMVREAIDREMEKQ
jgi:hypothetical protein